jgi:hypothetical protein
VSAVVASRPLRVRGSSQTIGRAGAQVRRPVPAGDGLTLGRKLDSVWEGLRAGGTAECPVCHGPMAVPGRATVVRCGGCGSRLG